ncbi:hypothetical protein EC845_2181 [Comamonas sp. BIGb0124]|uniref:HTH-like domain-containing protein n=1 Tax=Comamonas sp. BIGb0124 TaxID=2485130 RepID=UPI000F469EB6|nr:transcription factor [Comamonas sp. BIGb0124]ROR21368.1 hypothetical protein EC845_2181 [Comamonas sp. BIGb0124]
MINAKTLQAIRTAIDSAPRNAYVAELHLQIVKYANELQPLSGKAFCEALGISQAYGTEFTKMLKIAPRLRLAGMDQTRI